MLFSSIFELNESTKTELKVIVGAGGGGGGTNCSQTNCSQKKY